VKNDITTLTCIGNFIHDENNITTVIINVIAPTVENNFIIPKFPVIEDVAL
jgi:hypothetical protein